MRLTLAETLQIHWHDSYPEDILYDADKQQVSILLNICEWNDADAFSGKRGMLTFEGVTEWVCNPALALLNAANHDLEFLHAELINNALQLSGMHEQHQWFEIKLVAAQATWHELEDS